MIDINEYFFIENKKYTLKIQCSDIHELLKSKNENFYYQERKAQHLNK